MNQFARNLLLPCVLITSSYFMATGCFNQALDKTEIIQSEDSQSITLEAYQSGDIKLKIPSGNLNPQLSWMTLFDNLPSTTQKEFQKFAKDPSGLKLALETKYQKTIRSLARDPDTLMEIHIAARAFGIDPVLVLGNVIGEHTFNVGLVDSVQSLIVLSASWGAKWALRFQSNGTSLVDLVRMPQFDRCRPRYETSHAEYWDCVGWIWETQFRGKTVHGVTYQNNGFRLSFFNPVGSGLTYGLGQMDPIRALMVTDMVNKTSGHRLLSIERPEEIYTDIINPRIVVYYVAANIRLAIDAYYSIAHMDISGNAGIVASLYNLGKEKHFARSRYEDNIQRLRKGLPIELARESYYGFFVNEKEHELRRLLQMSAQELRQVARTGHISK